ncbi:MAG: EamA family transporter [bacterium]
MNSLTFIYIGLTVLFFGTWGLFMKIGQERLGSMNNLLLMGITILPITIIGVLLYRSYLPTLSSAYIFPISAAISTVLGMYFLTSAISNSDNNITAIFALSALYPGVTAFLAFLFLNENITIQKIAGLILAIIAAILFAL